MDKINCADFLIREYFHLSPYDFKNTYGTDYPRFMDIVRFLAQYGYFIGCGFKGLTTHFNFSKSTFRAFSKLNEGAYLIQTRGEEVDHVIIYSNGITYDIAGKEFEYYVKAKKVFGIYLITKVE